jgi:hypothetical protein
MAALSYVRNVAGMSGEFLFAGATQINRNYLFVHIYNMDKLHKYLGQWFADET